MFDGLAYYVETHLELKSKLFSGFKVVCSYKLSFYLYMNVCMYVYIIGIIQVILSCNHGIAYITMRIPSVGW